MEWKREAMGSSWAAQGNLVLIIVQPLGFAPPTVDLQSATGDSKRSLLSPRVGKWPH